MKKLVRWVLPPFLILLLTVQFTAAITQKEKEAHIREVVAQVAEQETNAVRELLEAEYSRALISTLQETKISLSAERETNFSIENDAYNARLEALWSKFLEDQRRIEEELELKINAFKSIPAPEETQPKSVSLLEHFLRQVEEKFPEACHKALNIRNAVVEVLLEIGVVLHEILACTRTLPSSLQWIIIITLIAPGVFYVCVISEQLNELDRNLTKHEEIMEGNVQIANPQDTDTPSSSEPPNITDLTRYPQGKPSTTLRRDVRDIFPGPMGSQDDSSSSSSSSSHLPTPSPPQLSADEIQKIKEKTEKGNKALHGWFDTFREDQVQALEEYRPPTENGVPPRRSPGPIPGPNTTHSTTPQPTPSVAQAKTEPNDSPTLAIKSHINPLSGSTSSIDDDGPSPQEPEAVSDDDELMAELMDEPILTHPFPKPSLPQSQQKPTHQFGLPQFPSQGQLPALQLENPQFQANRFQRMRADSEPVLMRSPAKPNPVINASPNPIVSPRESLTDSQSLRKNAMRAKKLEREEPEPQPVQTSPVVVPRGRSTSVESESQQATRVARTERSATHGSSSPTPIAREAIYRKDLEASQGDQDSASKPKRELEQSDNFESELEAESQPGSDSERDSDLE